MPKGGVCCTPKGTRFAFSFPPGNENKCVAAVETGGKQQSTGLLHLDGFESLLKHKKLTGYPGWDNLLIGTPKGTRTPDLLVRSQSLYPTELSAHNALFQALRYNST